MANHKSVPLCCLITYSCPGPNYFRYWRHKPKFKLSITMLAGECTETTSAFASWFSVLSSHVYHYDEKVCSVKQLDLTMITSLATTTTS